MALAGHADARGFRQWQEVGRWVRKGEKSFTILAPVLKTVRDEATGKEKEALLGFRGIPVFGFGQTDGRPLPPADPDTAARLTGEYAAQWGFPADAVAAWRTSASRGAPGDRHYSTHVFTAGDIGFVHLEFQVSHHVRERDFIVAALFSWHNHAA